MKFRIPTKRDQEFQASILKLSDSWLETHISLALKGNINYAEAGKWRPEIYYTQRDLYYALSMAYTNKHTNVHDKMSRLWLKEFHLNYATILLQACGDKLAHLLREFLDIQEFIGKNHKKRKATRKSTTLSKLIQHLSCKRTTTEIWKRIFVVIWAFWNNEEVKNTRGIANSLKHRSARFYAGIKPSDKIKLKKDKNGGRRSVRIDLRIELPKDIYKDIKIVRDASNQFVLCAKHIDKIINFNQFDRKN